MTKLLINAPNTLNYTIITVMININASKKLKLNKNCFFFIKTVHVTCYIYIYEQRWIPSIYEYFLSVFLWSGSARIWDKKQEIMLPNICEHLTHLTSISWQSWSSFLNSSLFFTSLPLTDLKPFFFHLLIQSVTPVLKYYYIRNIKRVLCLHSLRTFGRTRKFVARVYTKTLEFSQTPLSVCIRLCKHGKHLIFLL